MSKRSMVDFIATERREGKTDTEIVHDLLEAGWHMDIIHKTMHGAPIQTRGYTPILDIKKQPFRRDVIAVVFALLIVLLLLAAFA